MVTLVGIYHPPYNETTKCTDAMFLDDLAEFLEEVLTSYSNIIIAGDFNLHIDDIANPDAQVFLDLLTAFGLQNHVDFPTHKSEHTLDLILSECISCLSIKDSIPIQYLSDHTSIVSHLSIDKPPLEVKDCTYHKLKGISIGEISTRLNKGFANFKTMDLETMIADLDTQLKIVLSEMAPERTKGNLVRPTNPWLVYRRSESSEKANEEQGRQWRKYKFQPKAEHNKYRAMLQSIRKSILSNKVNDCNNDTKKLSALVNGIMGRASENPMPKSHCDEQLAEEFVDYFMAKIKKIHDSLKNYPTYEPVHQDIKQLREFQPLTEQEVSKIIGRIASKSCENDPIPTKILKKVLPSVVGPITSIVNNSITTGIFVQSWKTAIVHPILKKAGLALQLSNFRQVSNLSFLSCVVNVLYSSSLTSIVKSKISSKIIKVLIVLTIAVKLL